MHIIEQDRKEEKEKRTVRKIKRWDEYIIYMTQIGNFNYG
jgi:hypothetical protein